jgi:hypothetical protein
MSKALHRHAAGNSDLLQEKTGAGIIRLLLCRGAVKEVAIRFE